MAQPTDLPRWSTDPGTTTEPTEAKKDDGFVAGEKPAAQTHNWLFNTIYLWCDYLKNITSEALTWTAVQTIQGSFSGVRALLVNNTSTDANSRGAHFATSANASALSAANSGTNAATSFSNLATGAAIAAGNQPSATTDYAMYLSGGGLALVDTASFTTHPENYLRVTNLAKATVDITLNGSSITASAGHNFSSASVSGFDLTLVLNVPVTSVGARPILASVEVDSTWLADNLSVNIRSRSGNTLIMRAYYAGAVRDWSYFISTPLRISVVMF
jgi:hypothetical protein